MDASIFGTRRSAWIVLVLGIVVALIGISGKGPLISDAQEYSQDIAESSAATFVSLRAINAAISFVEEVQVTGSAVFASGSVSPFKVLEPIDDAVEQLSSAIFWVGAISGILTVVLPVLGGVSLIFIGLPMSTLAGLQLIKPKIPFERNIAVLCTTVARLGGIGLLTVMSFTISSYFADGISDRAWGKYEALLSEVAEALPSVGTDDVAVLTEPTIVEPQKEENVADGSRNTSAEEDMGFFDQAGDLARSAYESASNAVSGTVSSVGEYTGGIVDSVASTSGSTFNNAKVITEVFVEKADDLVVALMGIFAAFLFKTAVFPVLILFGLFKTLRTFNLARVEKQ